MQRRAPAAVVLDPTHPGRKPQDWEVGPTEFRVLLRSGRALGHILRHPSARLLVDDVELSPPLKAILASRLLTAGPAWIEDRCGRRVRLDAARLACLVAAWWRDRAAAAKVLQRAEREVAGLEAALRQPRAAPPFDPSAGALFLHTEWGPLVAAGGSLAHLAGVLNELQRQCGPIDLVAGAAIPLLDEDIRLHRVTPEVRAWTSAELHRLHFNERLAQAAARLAGGPGRLIYQRYSLDNWTGAALARRDNRPFVLEFNGPELWMAESWGVPLRHARLAARIEQANLEAADLVSVVSEPLRRHVVERGIPEERVLLNPNGVDPDRFRPDLDGGAARTRLGVGGALVIGFIGTFGPWHGVETLAEAFAALLRRRPELRARVRLLLIGDGLRRPAAQTILAAGGALGETVFAGLVPQVEGPAYLAACDILAVPTAPNPDGSDFFGSPTKLFEAMAMGKPIVATAVGQVAEVITEGVDGLLTPPADPEAMSAALERLVDDEALRRSLAAAARQAAVERHSWRGHVARLLSGLAALVNGPALGRARHGDVWGDSKAS